MRYSHGPIPLYGALRDPSANKLRPTSSKGNIQDSELPQHRHPST
jgi:hypothetical protein